MYFREDPSAPALHGFVAVRDSDLTVDPPGPFTARIESSSTISISKEGLQTQYFFHAPYRTVRPIIPKAFSMDVCHLGQLLAVAGTEGQLKVTHLGNPQLSRTMSGHLGDVLTCKFFPSGEVLLSGGADLTLRIWSVLDGSCAVTLKGHTAGVFDTAFVDRGRNFISCSRDGSVRLWDCASASEIRTLHRQGPAVNAVCVGSAVGAGAGPAGAEGTRDAREWGTDGQHAVAATQDGVLLGLDCRGPDSTVLGRHATGAAFNCVARVDSDVLAGAEDGCVYRFDLRSPGPGVVLQPASSPAQSIALPGMVSYADGFCALVQHNTDASHVHVLSGVDGDPVVRIAALPGGFAAAAGDGTVRLYAPVCMGCGLASVP